MTDFVPSLVGALVSRHSKTLRLKLGGLGAAGVLCTHSAKGPCASLRWPPCDDARVVLRILASVLASRTQNHSCR